MRHHGIIFIAAASIAGAGAQDLLSKPAANTISSTTSYTAATGEDRVNWAIRGTIGPASLAGEVFAAGWGTAFDQPSEYGPHWSGFGSRYGLGLSGVAASNTVEAGLGAAWGEDPRYFRAAGEPFWNRLGHAAKFTFLAKDRDGHEMPAYARYTAIVGTNYLSNTWRPDSDATGERAAVRIGLGVLGRFGGNVWAEFWPDVKKRVFHRGGEEER